MPHLPLSSYHSSRLRPKIFFFGRTPKISRQGHVHFGHNLSVGRAPGDLRSCGTNTAWGWVLQRKCRATDFVATNLTVAVQKFNSNCCHRPNPSPRCRTSARRGTTPTADGRHLHRSIALEILRPMIHSIALRSQDRHSCTAVGVSSLFETRIIVSLPPSQAAHFWNSSKTRSFQVARLMRGRVRE